MEQSPRETGINSLRRVLELERRKGYDDRAVIGGLDKFLRRQEGRILQDITDRQLLASFNNLGFATSDYRSWDKKRRQEWIAAIFNWLDRAEAARERKRTTAAAGSPAAAARSRKKTSPGLDLSITSIRGIAATTADRFARLGVKTIYDLLHFFPRRYIDYSQRKPIAELGQGKEQTIIATVWQSRIVKLGRRRGTELIVGDDTGNIRAVWFNQPYLAKNFRINATVAISGMVSSFKGQRVFISPEWELVQTGELIHTARLVPVYPLTSGLYPRQVRKWTREAVDGWAWQLTDFLPPEIKRRCRLPDLPEAIAQAHYPDSTEKAEEARKRLAFDELFLLQLGLLLRKQNWQQSQPGNAFTINQELLKTFLSYLPFALTSAQERVLHEVMSDLKQPRAMSRLLQGEVGSGKTVIATLALLIASNNGYQGALMAPTEVLAEQHFNNITSYLSRASGQPEPPGQSNLRQYGGIFPRPLTVALLTGSITGSEKENLQGKIRQGEVDIVIGTHAIIQKDVNFARLGIIVVDEQHKFGVMQRGSLIKKGLNPDVLIMTATPIPRTLAMSVFGDLDVSIIDEMPPGRKRAKTWWAPREKMAAAYDFIRAEIRKGRQAYFVYPLVEESQDEQTAHLKAATEMAETLRKKVFPEFKVGLLHGRMSGDEKDAVMRAFRDGRTHILVSTIVIEVGIDVPNATIMVIEHAERFGLSQLHQLRGRIGRGAEESYCILFGNPRTPEGEERLKIISRTTDGFKIAEEDLRLRGPGQFFGTRQHGLPELKVANLVDDYALLRTARADAFAIAERRPLSISGKSVQVAQEYYGRMLAEIRSRFAEFVELIGVG